MSYKLIAVTATALLTSLAAAMPASAGETVFVCDVYGDTVAPPPLSTAGIGASTICPGNDTPGSYTGQHPPGGLALWTKSNHTVRHGAGVRWTVKAPAGLTISSVYIPHMYSQGIDDGTGWHGGFFWQGGSGGVTTFDGESSWSSAYTGSPKFTWAPGTPYFGWQVICNSSPCTNGGSQWLSVELLELGITETTGPALTAPDGLWAAVGWVRGTWTLHYGGDSPTGMCALSASLNGQALPGSATGPRDYSVWHQCSAPAVNAPVNTAQYGQGALSLTLAGKDGADKVATETKTLQVDNQAPTITLNGPKDAPSTAGVQYISATASAGPSGVAGIVCSVDNAPGQWHSGPAAQVPVQGVGVHHVTCASANNARDQAGKAGTSDLATWTTAIREPSVASVAFARIAARLRCRHARERVRIPPHWVKAYHRGHRVRIRLPGQTRVVKIVHCHPRIVRRRIRVNGRWVTERVAVFPHTALVASKRVRAGHATTITGWLGTSAGNALGGQRVVVFAAPDDGSGHYVKVATAKTSANGVWRAHLGPGPSRIVLVGFAGSASVEPSVSAPVRLLVPASLALHISPTSTHWGGQIQIDGRLRGGHIPQGGELVVLWAGWPGGSTEIGHLYSKPDGTFSTRYTFLRGNGTERYRLWVASARESGYPFAPGRSRPVTVTVGP